MYSSMFLPSDRRISRTGIQSPPRGAKSPPRGSRPGKYIYLPEFSLEHWKFFWTGNSSRPRFCRVIFLLSIFITAHLVVTHRWNESEQTNFHQQLEHLNSFGKDSSVSGKELADVSFERDRANASSIQRQQSKNSDILQAESENYEVNRVQQNEKYSSKSAEFGRLIHYNTQPRAIVWNKSGYIESNSPTTQLYPNITVLDITLITHCSLDRQFAEFSPKKLKIWKYMISWLCSRIARLELQIQAWVGPLSAAAYLGAGEELGPAKTKVHKSISHSWCSRQSH